MEQTLGPIFPGTCPDCLNVKIAVGQGTCQKRFSGFCPLRGYPPPTPLTENQCEKKKVFFLSGIGGYPPPLNGKSPKKILKKWVKKG